MKKAQAMSEEEQNLIEWKLKITGWKKTSDCMWVKIYRLNDHMQVTLIREW